MARRLPSIIGGAVLLSGASASVLHPSGAELVHDIPRALPANAPHGYTPQYNQCPSTAPTIRRADSLASEESAWLPKRRHETIQPMQDLLGRMNITGFDVDGYMSKYKGNISMLPNVGIAVSGGGYRALLNGAGNLAAFDNRTPNATNTGQLGGLLQSATYLSGLSGGSWLVGSLYTNNFTSVTEIMALDTPADDSGGLWQFGQSIFDGPQQGFFHEADYYVQLVSDVQDKANAGFNTTITDVWGRALSYQLVNATEGGPQFTFSSIADQEWFSNGSVPLVMIVSDSRRPGEMLLPTNSTIFTFDPWEFGTFDPTVYGFAPMKYVGTSFEAGKTVADTCVTGFDNVGYVMGTSSTLFNEALLKLNKANDTYGSFPSVVDDLLDKLLEKISGRDDDIADYPNPFYHYLNDSQSNHALVSSVELTLVDGGEDGQNIPLHPLIQPLRHVDVIFAIDSSADTTASKPNNGSAANWPMGEAMQATYRRSKAAIQNGTAFPSIPGISTFVNLGLNNRPTFFGCNASNITGEAPLIIYLPNAPYTFASNTSTYQMAYNDTERNEIILNAYNGATQGNGTLDAEWPACVGCAMLSRSLSRTGTAVPDVCNSCFERYCWNGTIDESTPAPYVPKVKLSADAYTKKSAAVPVATMPSHMVYGVVALIAVTGFFVL